MLIFAPTPASPWLHWGPMKVFLSWSGEQSKAVARALREWLPFIFPGSETWMSDRDLDAGVRWAEEIEGSLKGSNFGVICVTAGNRNSPWLNFEAGAISNNLSADGNEKSRVVPYLLDIGFPDVKGPLAQFHGKQANKAGTWELVQALNRISSQAHEPGRLQVIFDRFWPDLEGTLGAIPREKATAEAPAPAARGAEDKLDELLLLVRSLAAGPSERAIQNLERRNNASSKIAARGLETMLENAFANANDVLSCDVTIKDDTRQVNIMVESSTLESPLRMQIIQSIVKQIVPDARVNIESAPF